MHLTPMIVLPFYLRSCLPYLWQVSSTLWFYLIPFTCGPEGGLRGGTYLWVMSMNP